MACIATPSFFPVPARAPAVARKASAWDAAAEAPIGVIGAPSSVFLSAEVSTSTSKMAARSFSKNPGLHEPVTTASKSSVHSAVLSSPLAPCTR